MVICRDSQLQRARIVADPRLLAPPPTQAEGKCDVIAEGRGVREKKPTALRFSRVAFSFQRPNLLIKTLVGSTFSPSQLPRYFNTNQVPLEAVNRVGTQGHSIKDQQLAS